MFRHLKNKAPYLPLVADTTIWFWGDNLYHEQSGGQNLHYLYVMTYCAHCCFSFRSDEGYVFTPCSWWLSFSVSDHPFKFIYLISINYILRASYRYIRTISPVELPLAAFGKLFLLRICICSFMPLTRLNSSIFTTKAALRQPVYQKILKMSFVKISHVLIRRFFKNPLRCDE